jgi:hypothetical protein
MMAVTRPQPREEQSQWPTNATAGPASAFLSRLAEQQIDYPAAAAVFAARAAAAEDFRFHATRLFEGVRQDR